MAIPRWTPEDEARTQTSQEAQSANMRNTVPYRNLSMADTREYERRQLLTWQGTGWSITPGMERYFGYTVRDSRARGGTAFQPWRMDPLQILRAEDSGNYQWNPSRNRWEEVKYYDITGHTASPPDSVGTGQPMNDITIRDPGSMGGDATVVVPNIVSGGNIDPNMVIDAIIGGLTGGPVGAVVGALGAGLTGQSGALGGDITEAYPPPRLGDTGSGSEGEVEPGWPTPGPGDGGIGTPVDKFALLHPNAPSRPQSQYKSDTEIMFPGGDSSTRNLIAPAIQGGSNVNVTDIRTFHGVYTNADWEDLPIEMATDLVNLRPSLNQSRLEKTFGIGAKQTTAVGALTDDIVRGFTTYLHDALAQDKLYILVYVDTSTKVVTIMANTGAAADTAWVNINTLTANTSFGTYYHKSTSGAVDENPIIQYAQELRVLPGNVGYATGSSEAKGIWVGYIDRDFFDACYTPTAGFYDFATTIDKPTLTLTLSELSSYTNSLFTSGDVFYYKISYIYDGVQESQISYVVSRWDVSAAAKWPCLTISGISESTFNKRVTGIKVYRTQKVDTNDILTGYRHIHTINLLRPAADIPGATTGGYSGDKACYVPGATGYSFNAGYSYRFEVIDGSTTYYTITNPGAGDGHTTFLLTADMDVDNWNKSWDLQESTGGDFASVATGTSGFYGGYNTAIVSTSLTDNQYVGGVVILNATTTNARVIDKNYQKAVHFADTMTELTTAGGYAWKVMPATDTYYNTDGGTTHAYTFFDPGFADQDYHPLEGVSSIKVNGEFAAMVGSRMWQGNIVIDPGTANEAHEDWGSYSEEGQPDVTPIGNVRRIQDRAGGPITGLHEFYGNPVFLKKQSITIINQKNAPSDPSLWYEQETKHDIGCIAKRGSLVYRGYLYVCSYDGIYRLAPNNLSPSDTTPTELLKLSEPINDVYMALTQAQKEAIILGVDQKKDEIIIIGM